MQFVNKYFVMRKAATPEAEVNAFIAESAKHEIKVLDLEPLAGQFSRPWAWVKGTSTGTPERQKRRLRDHVAEIH